jgi:carboxyl-terminal processing protease
MYYSNQKHKKLVEFMKKFSFVLLLIVALISCKAQSLEKLIAKNSDIDSAKVILPDVEHSQDNRLITQLISRYHYKKFDLNDSLSSIIFDNYLKMLDNNKVYFLKSDLDEFETFRNKFDDFLLTGTLEAGYSIFNRYKQRLAERIEYVDKELKTEFDYSIDESFTPNRKDAEWAASSEELDEIWRKRLKNDALNRKLDGREWDEIAKTLGDRYHRYHKIILQYDEEDVFQLYMNAYTEAVDPHTSYFSPITSENFDIDMSLSLEGIGAQLMSEDDYTKVSRIIPGGPADKSGLLQKDDRIIGVAQGEDGEMVDVFGWRLDDVVQLIRGEKGTRVRLNVIPADADVNMASKEIIIERDKVKLEDQAAKSEIILIENEGTEYKLGVIDIPAFYIDFDAQRKGDPDYKSTTRDVRKLLDELKKESVDGVIIDLRENGGGSLQEAIELTGLFIEQGPVVQVRNANGSIEVGRDPDKDIAYSGPLAVMVNKYSASASEIFSGAVQDYGRGLVIGETTYGKGTVQNLIDLGMFKKSKAEKEGKVKMTIAKYYRVTGSSTQHMGVIPDIVFPGVIDAHEFGESSKPSALPWDQIPSTNFQKFSDLGRFLPELRKKHDSRISNNLEFQYRLEDIDEYNERKNKTEFSLNEEVRKQERELAAEKRKKREEERETSSSVTVIEKGEVTKKNLRVDDPELEEAGYILTDLIAMNIG